MFETHKYNYSRRVDIGKAVEEVLGERRGGDRKSEDFQSGKISTLNEGKKTRTIAAEKAGFGNPETYRQELNSVTVLPTAFMHL